MIIKTLVGPIFPEEISSDHYQRLLNICPIGMSGGSNTYGFNVLFEPNDNRLQLTIDVLHKAGLVPLANHWREHLRGREYPIMYYREYNAQDYAACELLELRPPNEHHHEEGIYRDKEGRIMISKPRIAKKKWDIAVSLMYWYLVPDRVKRLIESAGMKGVKFVPTVAVKDSRVEKDSKTYTWDQAGGEPWWELDSDRTLPAVSPKMELHDYDENPARGEQYARGLHPYEGNYAFPELHYRLSDLREIEPFDVAKTYECFGNVKKYEPDWRPVIVSKRFFDFCVKNKLKTGWTPVRIDPD